MSERTFQHVPIDRVKCRPQARKKFSEEVIAGMVQSILAVGILQPIQVEPDGDNFVVIDGELRLRAAKQAALTMVPVIIEQQPLSRPEFGLRQLISNCQRQDLSPLETADAIDALMKASGWNGTQVAAKLGKSSATITKLLSLVTLPEFIRQQIESGAIPVSAGYELAKVSDPEQQAQLVSEMTSGHLTRDGLIQKVRAQRNVPQESSSRLSPTRVTAKLNADRFVTVSAPGLNLSVFIEVLEPLTSRARQARTKGMSLSDFIKLLKLQNFTGKKP